TLHPSHSNSSIASSDLEQQHQRREEPESKLAATKTAPTVSCTDNDLGKVVEKRRSSNDEGAFAALFMVACACLSQFFAYYCISNLGAAKVFDVGSEHKFESISYVVSSSLAIPQSITAWIIYTSLSFLTPIPDDRKYMTMYQFAYCCLSLGSFTLALSFVMYVCTCIKCYRTPVGGWLLYLLGKKQCAKMNVFVFSSCQGLVGVYR
ncbi:hypothetical protein AKJ16_DCAP13554, partial [Drosera capensis]